MVHRDVQLSAFAMPSYRWETRRTTARKNSAAAANSLTSGVIATLEDVLLYSII